MAKKVIYQMSFLISGIMCHAGCGFCIEDDLNDLESLKKEDILPQDAEITIDAEPESLGIHRIYITIESEEQNLTGKGVDGKVLFEKFKSTLEKTPHFKVIADVDDSTPSSPSTHVNLTNILINLSAILGIVILSVIFPASLLLTTVLTAISCLTTAYTARHYLFAFLPNLRKKNVLNMDASISLGWFLSSMHTLYHAMIMPLVTTFSMVFMSFLMPVMLILTINVMDEIKRLVLNKSSKMHLKSLQTLFPQMEKEYSCYSLSEQYQQKLSQLLKGKAAHTIMPQEIDEMLSDDKLITQNKNTLTKGMVIRVKRGACFPVDGMIIQGDTLVDVSILTGETKQFKQYLDTVPSGAINLGHDVVIYATQNCYNSAVNRLLFRSNRDQKLPVASKLSLGLSYLYTGVMMAGVVAAIIAPLVMGIFAIPLVLQNLTGVLFAICPCTMAIAWQLAKLLSIYQRNNKGVVLRHEHLAEVSDEIHTIVFDKTGTLTTGNSQVDSSEGISSALWQRIYLLEKHHGEDHPLAKAITDFYAEKMASPSILNDIKNVSKDIKNQGLSGCVQGRTVHIGNSNYLQQNGIKYPEVFSHDIKHKLSQGYTPVFIAEEHVYQGVILIKHEIRKDILADLVKLKAAKIKLIMLTGDSPLSASGFNQQHGSIFDTENIHAEQTPLGKEAFLKKLMTTDKNPKGIWFVGDGLNDAPAARIVTDHGGTSCAMTFNDKAAFFTDMSLDGSLTYVFEHHKLNCFFKKITIQNQWIMVLSALSFFAFILSFSAASLAVSPLIPMAIMASTTLFILFNSWRAQLSVDHALDKKPSLSKQYLVSDWSIGLLMSANNLLIGSALMSVVTTGLIVPAVAFNTGVVAAMLGVGVLAGSAALCVFLLLGVASLLVDRWGNPSEKPAAVDSKRGASNDATNSSSAFEPRPDCCEKSPASSKGYSSFFPFTATRNASTLDRDTDIPSVLHGVGFGNTNG